MSEAEHDRLVFNLAMMIRRLLIRSDRRTNTARAAEALLREADARLTRP